MSSATEARWFRLRVHGCKAINSRTAAMLAVMMEFSDWDDASFRRNKGFGGINMSKTTVAHHMGKTRGSDIDDWVNEAVSSGWLIVEDAPRARPWRFRIVFPPCCVGRDKPSDRCTAKPRTKRGNRGNLVSAKTSTPTDCPEVQVVTTPNTTTTTTPKTTTLTALNIGGLPSNSPSKDLVIPDPVPDEEGNIW